MKRRTFPRIKRYASVRPAIRSWLPWPASACLVGLISLSVAVGSDGRPSVDPFAMLVESLSRQDDATVQAALLQGMLHGLEGRRNLSPPRGWAELSERLRASDSEAVRKRAAELSQIFGDRAAVAEALATAADTSQSINRRRAALTSLLNQQNRDASELLESLIDQPAMTLDAIRGFAVVENPAAPDILLARFHDFAPQQQRAVIETLASRRVYAEALLAALQDGRIDRQQVPAQVARALDSMLGERFTKVYGEVRPVAEDRARLLAHYKKLSSESAIAAADASRGRAVFQKTCAACHKLYGEGGKVGPDLTGSNRANLDYILLNSVDPSYDVPDAYRTTSVVTVDGRLVNGVLAEEDPARIVLKTPEQARVVIAKDDIEFRRVLPQSMMPDGQLDQMKKQEVLDLIKYLRTTEQVELKP